MMQINIPDDHPRAESLRIREKLIEGCLNGVVAYAGLIAHGRGEAFDYLIGEQTVEPAKRAIEAAVAALLTAEHPVISVNGNAAALVPQDLVKLAEITGAKLEVNLFYRSPEREEAIKRVLESAGAKEVLGVGENASARIPEVGSERRRVDPRGILIADVVLVPLEDGDRTEALVKMGKTVIAIDLNPLSRTAQTATITIVDNIIRAIPTMISAAQKLKSQEDSLLRKILNEFDNRQNLAEMIEFIANRLKELAKSRMSTASSGGF